MSAVKKRHLALRIAAIGAVRVSLDELADREPIGGFVGADGDVFAHGVVSPFGGSRAAAYLDPHCKQDTNKTRNTLRFKAVPLSLIAGVG